MLQINVWLRLNKFHWDWDTIEIHINTSTDVIFLKVHWKQSTFSNINSSYLIWSSNSVSKNSFRTEKTALKTWAIEYDFTSRESENSDVHITGSDRSQGQWERQLKSYMMTKQGTILYTHPYSSVCVCVCRDGMAVTERKRNQGCRHRVTLTDAFIYLPLFHTGNKMSAHNGNNIVCVCVCGKG